MARGVSGTRYHGGIMRAGIPDAAPRSNAHVAFFAMAIRHIKQHLRSEQRRAAVATVIGPSGSSQQYDALTC